MWGPALVSNLLASFLGLCCMPEASLPPSGTGPLLWSTESADPDKEQEIPLPPGLAECCLAVCQGAGVKMLCKASDSQVIAFIYVSLWSDLRLPSSKTLQRQSKAVGVLTTGILEAGDSRADT